MNEKRNKKGKIVRTQIPNTKLARQKIILRFHTHREQTKRGKREREINTETKKERECLRKKEQKR